MFVEVVKMLADLHLEMLDLSFNCLQLPRKLISPTMSNIHTLTYLNLNNCFMTNECVNDLMAVFMNNIALNSLYLRGNQLTTSGVISICQSLKYSYALKNLNIGNKGVDEDSAEAIASAVMSSKNINTLTLSGCKLQNKSVKIFRALQVVSSVTTLHLGYMNMSDDVVTDLVLAINNSPFLKELNLCGNLLSKGLIEITQACKRSLKYLIAFNVQWNSVDPSAIPNLMLVIGTINILEVLLMGGLALTSNEKSIDNLCLHLEKLYSASNMTSVAKCHMVEVLNYELQQHKISSNIKANCDSDYTLFNYTDAVVVSELFDSCLTGKPGLASFQKAKQKLLRVDAVTIVYLLPVISKLKVLDLEQSNVDEVAAFELAALLGCNSVLEQLWLGGNQLGCAGAIFILNSLVHLSTLKALDLSFNNIGCQSADSVAAVIQCNPMLQYLCLDGNDLMDAEIVTICQALKCMTKLRVLSMSSNRITDDAAEVIALAVASNSCLEDLSLGNNKLKCEGLCKIVHSLNSLCRLRKLDLYHNQVTQQVADELVIALSNCYTLQELYLSDNMLGTLGTKKIFKSLKYKSKLQVLTLSNNKITDEVIDELCLVLAQNPRLQVLLLGGNKLQTAGVVRIAQVVKKDNTIMHLLALCENSVDEQGKDKINMMFADNTLIHVYI